MGVSLICRSNGSTESTFLIKITGGVCLQEICDTVKLSWLGCCIRYYFCTFAEAILSGVKKGSTEE